MSKSFVVLCALFFSLSTAAVSSDMQMSYEAGSSELPALLAKLSSVAERMQSLERESVSKGHAPLDNTAGLLVLRIRLEQLVSQCSRLLNDIEEDRDLSNYENRARERIEKIRKHYGIK